MTRLEWAWAAIAMFALGGCGASETVRETANSRQPVFSATDPVLVGHWNFNEGTGQVLNDSSGNALHGRNGSLATADDNDATFVAPGTGSPTPLAPFALQFGGTAPLHDFVEVPSSLTGFNALEPEYVSVEAWLWASSSPGNGAYAVSKGADGCRADSYGLDSEGAAGLAFYVLDSQNNVLGSPHAPAASLWNSLWHHVVGTYDGTAVRLYVDGQPVTGTPVGTPGQRPIRYGLPTHNNLVIGAYNGPGCPLPFAGRIDAVRVYRNALTAAQVLQRYQGREVPDNDLDGVLNPDDTCDATPANTVVNSVGCSVEQQCPQTREYRNHGAYVSCVSNATSELLDEARITSEERSEIVSSAAHSDIGR